MKPPKGLQRMKTEIKSKLLVMEVYRRMTSVSDCLLRNMNSFLCQKYCALQVLFGFLHVKDMKSINLEYVHASKG